MVRLSALAAKTRFGEALDLALQGPVEIEKHGRRVAVLIAAKEYDRLCALKVFEPIAMRGAKDGRVAPPKDERRGALADHPLGK